MLLKIKKMDYHTIHGMFMLFIGKADCRLFTIRQLFHQAKQHILKSNAFYILTPLIDVIYKLKK